MFREDPAAADSSSRTNVSVHANTLWPSSTPPECLRRDITNKNSHLLNASKRLPARIKSTRDVVFDPIPDVGKLSFVAVDDI